MVEPASALARRQLSIRIPRELEAAMGAAKCEDSIDESCGDEKHTGRYRNSEGNFVIAV